MSYVRAISLPTTSCPQDSCLALGCSPAAPFSTPALRSSPFYCLRIFSRDRRLSGDLGLLEKYSCDTMPISPAEKSGRRHYTRTFLEYAGHESSYRSLLRYHPLHPAHAERFPATAGRAAIVAHRRGRLWSLFVGQDRGSFVSSPTTKGKTCGNKSELSVSRYPTG